MTAIHKLIDDYGNGTREQRTKRAVVANEYGVFKNAVREWFAEIQRSVPDSFAYQAFARNIVVPGDCMVTFNYDVSLERELKLAGKFEVGDGYGIPFKGLPGKSDTKVLKLHGSTNWLALLFGGMTSGLVTLWEHVRRSRRMSFPFWDTLTQSILRLEMVGRRCRR